jgi:adenosine kinase
LDDNQITAFHPGAMQHSHMNQVSAFIGAKIGVIAPDGRRGMIDHAQQFAASKVPFIFDPGQGLPMFDAADLKTFIGRATWVAVNEYEWQMLQEKTGWSEQDITARVEALIVTYGGGGSVIHTREARYEIPCAKPKALIDPTGCGDAYRAGVVHGLLQKRDWPTIGRLGSLMGAIKIESRGPQNHRFTRAEFDRRYLDNFG